MWGTMGDEKPRLQKNGWLPYLCTIAHFGGKTDVHDSNSPRAPDSCEYEWAQWETKSHDYKRTDGLRTYAQSLTYAAKPLYVNQTQMVAKQPQMVAKQPPKATKEPMPQMVVSRVAPMMSPTWPTSL